MKYARLMLTPEQVSVYTDYLTKVKAWFDSSHDESAHHHRHMELQTATFLKHKELLPLMGEYKVPTTDMLYQMHQIVADLTRSTLADPHDPAAHAAVLSRLEDITKLLQENGLLLYPVPTEQPPAVPGGPTAVNVTYVPVTPIPDEPVKS